MLELKKEKSLCTSSLTVIECRLVLLREGTKDEALGVEKVLKKNKVGLLPLDDKVISRSNSLMKKYDFLGTFDALHIATAIVNKEQILSTDHVFPMIKEVKSVDPREE